jgi:hypothetical protein
MTTTEVSAPAARARPVAQAEPERSAIAVVAGDVAPLACEQPPELLEGAGGPVDSMSLSLAVCGEDLHPDEVSRRLGCEPTAVLASRADLQASSTGEACAIGVWRLEVRREAPVHADELVELLLARFPTEPSFWQALHRDFAIQLRLSFHTAGWDSGFVLSTESLARCAATGASLLVTFHVGDRADS